MSIFRTAAGSAEELRLVIATVEPRQRYSYPPHVGAASKETEKVDILMYMLFISDILCSYNVCIYDMYLHYVDNTLTHIMHICMFIHMQYVHIYICTYTYDRCWIRYATSMWIVTVHNSAQMQTAPLSWPRKVKPDYFISDYTCLTLRMKRLFAQAEGQVGAAWERMGDA